MIVRRPKHKIQKLKRERERVMKKRLFRILLCLSMIMSLSVGMGITVSAANTTTMSSLTSDNGSTFTSASSGDTVTISSPDELNYLAAYTNAGQQTSNITWLLTANITLNDETFTFDPDTGLFTVTDNGNTAYLGTGIKGSSGGNETFDTKESTVGAWYASNDSATLGATYGGILNVWTPIGSSSSNFKGVFNGAGYTISGIYINSSAGYQGLFGSVDGQVKDFAISGSWVNADNYVGAATGNLQSGSVADVTVSGSYVQGSQYVGGIAGNAHSNSAKAVTISSAKVIGSIVNGSNRSCIGGIAGFAARSEIINCVTDASTVVTGDANSVGGIIGDNYGNVTNCVNLANVTGSSYVGGIVGTNQNGSVKNVYSTGSVTASNNAGSISGTVGSGGIVSYAYWLTGNMDGGSYTGIANHALSGAGTFSSSVTVNGITCGDLSGALNAWVAMTNSAFYNGWTAGDYPLPTELYEVKTITGVTYDSNAQTYTVAASGTPSKYQWYKFTAVDASSVAANPLKFEAGDYAIAAGSVSQTNFTGRQFYNENYAWSCTNQMWKSGNASADNSTCRTYCAMLMPINITDKDNEQITFESRVSSESGCDKLNFALFTLSGTTLSYVDNTYTSISGETDWATYCYPVSANDVYYLLVSYSKDIGTSNGDDAGYVRLVGMNEVAVTGTTIDVSGPDASAQVRCNVSYADGTKIATTNFPTAGHPITYYDQGSSDGIAFSGNAIADTYKTYYNGGISLPHPTKRGYTFGGWHTTYNGTTQVSAVGASETGTKTFYAKWTAQQTTSHSHAKTDNASSPVIVDGKVVAMGTSEVKGSTTTVKVDQNKMIEQIKNAKDSVVIPITAKTDTATAQLVVQNVEDMALRNMTLTVQSGKVAYNLNTAAIDTKALASIFSGTDTKLILFQVTIANTSVKIEGAHIIVAPVEFTITASYGGKTVEVETFNSFINRTIEITQEQAKKVTTAVVVKKNDTLRHVPTNVMKKNGKYYAVINSLTNSTYTLIQNEVKFTDASGKWYENAVNEMGSRKTIDGIGDNLFAGDRSVTRAEFATILVRALGLPTHSAAGSVFDDVSDAKWYYGAVGKAYAYGLVSGKGEDQFEPNANITRQEAMAMIARAAKVADYTGNTSNLSTFSDADKLGSWAVDAAKFNVGSGLIVGNNGTLRPQDQISRAETATVILRLLQKSELVDVRN